MSINIRFQCDTGRALAYSLERLKDGMFFDFSDSSFKASPAVRKSALQEGVGDLAGQYRGTLTATPTLQFTDGEYAVAIHDTQAGGLVIGQLSITMHGGDDAPVFPSAGSGLDPWATPLPGTYAPGTAGAKLAGLSAAADPWATVLPGNYPAGTAGAIVGGNLDVKVSSRSTYSGGPVAAVTAPVTVGTNNDKVGYSLASPPPSVAAIRAELDTNSMRLANLDAPISSRLAASTYTAPPTVAAIAGAILKVPGQPIATDTNGFVTVAATGLDAVSVESGVNARQAMSVILAACAGRASGAGTGSISFTGGNVSTTRIIATTDKLGNRTSVVLALPT